MVIDTFEIQLNACLNYGMTINLWARGWNVVV